MRAQVHRLEINTRLMKILGLHCVADQRSLISPSISGRFLALLINGHNEVEVIDSLLDALSD